MNSGIYILEFPDGSFYIGQSVDIYKRWSEHEKDLKNGKSARKLQEAFDRNYSVINFKVILKCKPDYLDMFEAYFIHKLQPNLNTSWPNAFRYDWRIIEEFINNASTLSSLEYLVARYYDNINELLILREETKKLQEQVDLTGTIADELEIEVQELKQLIKEPDLVGKLRAELSSMKEMYRLLNAVYYDEYKRISTYNSKPWWKRLWTRI